MIIARNRIFFMKKVLIIHFRAGRTDGVSMEIERRKEVLKSMGHQVRILSGPNQKGADYIIPEMEYDSPRIFRITKNSFGKLEDYSESKLAQEIEEVAEIIERKVRNIIDQKEIDILMLHNIFSHGRHLSAAKAFYNIVKDTGIPTIATHHDFFWEREDYQHPTCDYVRKYLNQYFIPKLPNIRHIVINSLAQKELKQRYDVRAKIVPDTFDFNQIHWHVDWFNHDFQRVIGAKNHDVIFLQPTKIVERKGVELAIDLVATLNQRKFREQLDGQVLYRGDEFLPESKLILVLAGYTEKGAQDYSDRLKRYAQQKSVILKDVSSRIGMRREDVYGKKFYSLDDSYVFADIVTYPSLWEGWGRHFIEAIFAKTPVVVYEYPVFQKDIRPQQYRFISLGKKPQSVSKNKFVRTEKKYLENAAQNIVDLLKNKELYYQTAEENYQIAKNNHSFQTLHTLLRQTL